MKPRKVSVVVPTIQLDNWLNETVSSILQNVGVEVELIVVHDGVKPDPTLKWMQDNRVKVVHFEQRRGLAAGSNAGLLAATNEIVARCDADDISFPNRLIEQLTFLEMNPNTNAVGTCGIRINELSESTGPIAAVTGNDVRKSLCFKNSMINSSMMFRKSAVLAVGGYDEQMKQMEDYDLLLRMARLGIIANLESSLIGYRVHSNQMSRGAKPSGYYISKVLKERVSLSKALKINRGTQFLYDFTWRLAQYLRYWRVIRPGYER